MPILEETSTRVAHHLPVDLVCTECGYGVAAPRVPDSCPMCQNDAWEPAAWRPFAAQFELLDPWAE